MLSIPSLVLLAAACLTVFASCRPSAHPLAERAYRHHRAICLTLFALGCALRLIALGTLPSGLSAEEALVGVQAKALWQTGGFYPDGMLTTVLPQWKGETTGPLLAIITAPFVGLAGISPLSVRLPLVLLSIAAMPAAYALGCSLSGRSAGRFMLFIYALCPYFVLGARMTCGANAALFLLPIASALLAAGLQADPASVQPDALPGARRAHPHAGSRRLKRFALLCTGMAVLALSAYTQTMMLVIAPAAVLGAAAVSLRFGKDRLHALLASALGLALSVPAILTVYVNLSGAEGFVLFGLAEIPNRALLTRNLPVQLAGAANLADVVLSLLIKVWCTAVGGIFQAVWVDNLDPTLYLPDGMLALTVVSLPLILLGAGALLLRRIDGVRCEAALVPPRAMLLMLSAVAFVCVVMFGDRGSFGIGGAPDVFDHAILFLPAALLMTAGWRQMQRRSAAGTRLLSGLLAVCVVWLGVHLFGGAYQAGATTYFDGFADACARARAIQAETGAQVNVTTTVYPHVEPDAAARVMYLCATDADMREEQLFTDIYAPGLEGMDDTQIYIVASEDTMYLDWGDMSFESFDSFAVIYPAEEQSDN